MHHRHQYHRGNKKIVDHSLTDVSTNRINTSHIGVIGLEIQMEEEPVAVDPDYRDFKPVKSQFCRLTLKNLFFYLIMFIVFSFLFLSILHRKVLKRKYDKVYVNLPDNSHFQNYMCYNCYQVINQNTVSVNIPQYFKEQQFKQLIIQTIVQQESYIDFENIKSRFLQGQEQDQEESQQQEDVEIQINNSQQEQDQDQQQENDNQINQQSQQFDGEQQIAVVMISIIDDQDLPASVFIGIGDTWEKAINQCLDYISEHDFQQNIKLVKVDMLGDFTNKHLHYDKINNKYYLQPQDQYGAFDNLKYGIFAQNMFFPSDFNRMSFIKEISKSDLQQENLEKPEQNQQKYQFFNLNEINGYISIDDPKIILDAKNLQNMYTFEKQLSFVWFEQENTLKSSIYNQKDKQKNNNQLIQEENVKNLKKINLEIEKNYQIVPKDIYQYLDYSKNYMIRNFQFIENRFAYNYFPNSDSISQRQYNLLRHAGATMSLCQIYKYVDKDKQILKVVESALNYLADRQMVCPNTQKNAICLKDEQSNLKLGGNGLSLLAFTYYTKITGDGKYMDLMEGLARRIMEVQKPSGEFGSHIVNAETGKLKKQQVIFYIGESMLGLLKLYELNPKAEYLECVRKGLDFIITVQGFDHWLMYALNGYNKIEVVQEHIDWALRVTQSEVNHINNIRDFDPDLLKTNNWTSYPNGSSFGTKGEGLMQTFLMLQRNNQHPQFQLEIIEAVNKILIYQNYMQLKPYNTLYFPKRQKSIGGILNHYNELQIQIDNNQHQASSQIAYLNYITGQEESM